MHKDFITATIHMKLMIEMSRIWHAYTHALNKRMKSKENNLKGNNIISEYVAHLAGDLNFE